MTSSGIDSLPVPVLGGWPVPAGLPQTEKRAEDAEMADREKLELEYNVPTTVALKFDTPQTGEGQYGPWHRYTVVQEDETDVSWFASPGAHEQVEALGAGKGDLLRITKSQGEKNEEGRRPDIYEVSLDGKTAGGDGKASVPEEASPIEPKKEPKTGQKIPSEVASIPSGYDATVGRHLQVQQRNCLHTVARTVSEVQAMYPDLPVFTSEDIRAMSISMFIAAVDKRAAIPNPKPKS